jgi:outer membrane lipoprotein LolB
MRVVQSLLGSVSMLVLLAGCASAPPRPTGSLIDIEHVQQWQARGRIGVSSAGGGGSGSFEWAQRNDVAKVQIRGPVGIGSVNLMIKGSGPEHELELQTGDGVTLESNAAWAELEARLGASLPAWQFQYWLLGRAAPGPHQWSGSQEEGAAVLEQQGWRIDYQRYSDESGAKLPTRLRAMNGDTRVRIVIDRWQLER